MEALGADTDGKDDFALADELSALSGVKLPQAVETIRTAPVLHNRVVDAPDMPKAADPDLSIGVDNKKCSNGRSCQGLSQRDRPRSPVEQ